MTKKINHIQESVAETTGKKLDPKVEIKSGASENIATSFQNEKTDSVESKEIFVKSLEFEPDNFKIDSTWWKEVTKADRNNPILRKFIHWLGLYEVKPRIKVNDTCDVIEYLEDILVDEHLLDNFYYQDKVIDWNILCKKWEQIFITYDAFVREVMKVKNCNQETVEQKYLMTRDELKEKLKNKRPRTQEYKKFFNEEIRWCLAWVWLGWVGLYHVWQSLYIWLAAWDNAEFDDIWVIVEDDDYPNNGCSGRLLKN